MAADLLKAYEKGDTSALVAILEKQALAAAKKGDATAYQKSYSQLKSLYRASAPASQPQTPTPTQSSGDTQPKTRAGLRRQTSASSPSSTSQDVIVALHLLILLCESDLSQFHSELESLPSSVVSSAESQWVIGIERGITEGSYQDVRNLLHTTPDPKDCFAPFVAIMQDTVRLEMAECAQASYDSLPILNLTTLLLLKDTKATEAFAKTRGWQVSSGRVTFPATTPATGNDAQAAAMQVDGETVAGDLNDTSADNQDAKQRLIIQTLGYARELESIV